MGKVVHTQTFSGGMDSVTAPEYKANNTAEYILNCNSLSSSSGDVGIITNILGNTLIPTDLPNGDNIRIGVALDEETNNFYSFMWNSLGYHTIFRFNSLEGRETIIIRNLIDTGDIDILRFDKDFLILHADVVANNLLYWVDGINPARKINIDKALDKSYAGYGTIIREDYINAYKRAPVFSANPVAYFSDTTKQFNRLYGKLYKFITRFVYDDGEKSNWSEYSNVPLPTDEPITGISAIPTNNNAIKITVETGTPIVESIEIAMQSTDNSVPDGNPLNFVLIATLNKDTLGISSDSNYTYTFYNDGNYPVTDVEKVIRPYSFMPKKPLCQSIVNNALVYWNGYEGFDNVELNVEVDVEYDDLYIESGVDNEFNDPLFIRTEHSVAYIRGSGGNRETYEALAVGSDVKAGNKFTLQVISDGELMATWYKEASSFDTASTIANFFRSQISGWNVHLLYLTEVETDVDGTASFTYGWRASRYFDSFPAVTPIQFNTLKDTGESINNIKLGSAVKLGITYEDMDGRKSLVYTVDALVVNINTINELNGFKKPIISLQIKHRPPIWAKYYQIVRSPDLVYQDYIQILIQQAIDFEGTDTTDYLDLVVGSLFTYQKLHPNTVLQYTFKAGDRMRLISWTDVDTLDKTFYDFYETEILSYSPSITEVKNETVATSAGSANVTIGGVNSIDNIGRIILIDGAERTITALVGGDGYTLSSAMSETKTFLSYSLIDKRGTIRIRKPNELIIEEFKDYSLVEIYTPSSNVNSSDVKTFNEFNIKFPIINWGTDTRSHAGSAQDQDGTNEGTLISTPAIIEFDNGTAYVRNRELPVTNNVPGAQVIIDSIEDAGYSDYYNSVLNNNGRLTVEDTGDGEVHFGSRARYSNNYIENTRINGLNDFDSSDREDYNDAYGDIKRTLFKENRVYVFKSLRDAWVPVRQNIISQADGTPVVGISAKLLNTIQYFVYEGGIGDNPESLATNAAWIYHVMPNAGVIVRIGGSGVIPISEIYHLDNKVKEYLKDAKKYGARIYGGFDRFSGLYVVSIGQYIKSLFKAPFNEIQWQLYDEEVEATYEIVTPPVHGDVDFTNTTQWTYTPDTDYVGSDSFTYRAFIDGEWSDPEQVCLNIKASTLTETAWRPKSSSYFCLEEGGAQTGYKGWSTLEEYVLGLNTLTGNEKPNLEGDANYAAPVYDPTTCPLTEPVPECPDRVIVIQICNSNSAIDDNFEVYLNDVLIGEVDLNENAQIGSVFIASVDTPEILDPDFSCAIEDMVYYYFNPNLLVGGTNTINMVNIQNNGNGNAGTVEIRNYLLNAGDLEAPCFVADMVYSGSSGASFELTFDYNECCTEEVYTITIDSETARTPNIEIIDDVDSDSVYSGDVIASTIIGPFNMAPAINTGTFTMIVTGADVYFDVYSVNGVVYTPVEPPGGTTYTYLNIPKGDLLVEINNGG